MAVYTTSTQNQNAAGQQYGAVLPKMPGYCFDADVPFSAMLTPQDQIHWLYKHYISGVQTEDIQNVDINLSALKAEFEELSERVAALGATCAELLGMVRALAEQTMQYDVTAGVYRPSIATERRVWQAEAPYGMTVAQMAELTVADCAAMTCLTLAKHSREERQEVVNMQPGWTAPAFNPNDYIKRDELELIEVSNLQDGDIYGVPATSLSTPTPAPAALMRKGTVEDLSELAVLWNDHLVTTNKEG